MEWNVMECIVLYRMYVCMNWIGLDWIGLEWNGMEWNGMECMNEFMYNDTDFTV